MPHYYPEHFYLWGYATLAMALFVLTVIGVIRVIRISASIGVLTLCLSALLLSFNEAVGHMGWLIVSRGTNMLSSTEHPYWEISEFLRMLERGIQIAALLLVVVSVLFMPACIRRIQFRHKRLAEQEVVPPNGP